MHRFLLLLMLAATLAGCADELPVDSDGDGFADDEEIAAGSDPENATSIPVVVAVAENATAYPAWGALDTATIRPGSSLGGYCTFNFLYEAPNGTGYIGTAAHCTDGVGERVELPGVGQIGTVVYDSDDVGSAVDFSLILLDAERIAEAHPQMLGFEGPTGAIEVAELARGDMIHLHGYGMVLGDQEETRDRSGFLVDWNDDEYNVDMPAVNGDSGSSLLHENGKAFGIISRYGIANTPPSTDQGPMMPYIFRELDAAGWGDVRLATI